MVFDSSDAHEIPVMCSKKGCREVCTKRFVEIGVCKFCVWKEIPEWARGNPVERQRIIGQIKKKYKEWKNEAAQ